jgi:FkbM family methyltransferase
MNTKAIECNGLVFHIRPGTTDEKVVPEVIKRHSYTRKDFTIEAGEYWADLGANIGTFSCFAAQRGARVVAYEPEAENYELLLRNVSTNGFGDSVVLYNKAVTFSGEDTVLYTCKSERNKYRHSIIPHKGWGHVRIYTDKFQDVLNQGVNCVKMDIEGSEFEIFDKCADWQNVSKLVFEYHFDIDKKIANFLRRMELLSKRFTNIYYSKLPNTEEYNFFPASKIVYCQR